MRLYLICLGVVISATSAYQDIDVEEDAVCQDKYGNIYFDVLVRNDTNEATRMTGISKEKICVSVKTGSCNEETNKELIRYMANLADVEPKNIELIKGMNEDRKILMVYNCTMNEKDLFDKLKNICDPSGKNKLEDTG